MLQIKLLTIKELAEKYNWSVSSVKRLIYASEDKTNFKRCVFRIGKKVLIREEDFQEWLFEVNDKIKC